MMNFPLLPWTWILMQFLLGSQFIKASAHMNILSCSARKAPGTQIQRKEIHRVKTTSRLHRWTQPINGSAFFLSFSLYNFFFSHIRIMAPLTVNWRCRSGPGTAIGWLFSVIKAWRCGRLIPPSCISAVILEIGATSLSPCAQRYACLHVSPLKTNLGVFSHHLFHPS